MIVELQCLASPPGTPDDPYRHIEAAIEVIRGSGLNYEVGALGTTVEGDPDQVWPLIRRTHEACLNAGAVGLITVIKVEQTTRAAAPTMASLTGKFRAPPQQG